MTTINNNDFTIKEKNMTTEEIEKKAPAKKAKKVTWLSSSKIKTIPPKKKTYKKKLPPQKTKITSFFN